MRSLRFHVHVSCSYSGTNKNNTLFARSECGGGTERLVNLIQRVCEYVVINIIFYRRIPLVVKQCIRMHLVIAGVEQTFISFIVCESYSGIYLFVFITFLALNNSTMDCIYYVCKAIRNNLGELFEDNLIISQFL